MGVFIFSTVCHNNFEVKKVKGKIYTTMNPEKRRGHKVSSDNSNSTITPNINNVIIYFSKAKYD